MGVNWTPCLGFFGPLQCGDFCESSKYTCTNFCATRNKSVQIACSLTKKTSQGFLSSDQKVMNLARIPLSNIYSKFRVGNRSDPIGKRAELSADCVWCAFLRPPGQLFEPIEADIFLHHGAARPYFPLPLAYSGDH